MDRKPAILIRKEGSCMRQRWIVSLFAAVFIAAAGAALAADRDPAKKAEKDELRVTTERVTRLAVATRGQKLTKADRKRINLGAHVQMAIRLTARKEGVKVSPEEVDRQLAAWEIPAGARDPERARSYDDREMALALRDVAESQLRFVKLARKAP